MAFIETLHLVLNGTVKRKYISIPHLELIVYVCFCYIGLIFFPPLMEIYFLRFIHSIGLWNYMFSIALGALWATCRVFIQMYLMKWPVPYPKQTVCAPRQALRFISIPTMLLISTSDHHWAEHSMKICTLRIWELLSILPSYYHIIKFWPSSTYYDLCSS